MFISKTPLRISLFGGGTDFPSWYRENIGIVVSSTIDSFIYLAANRCKADHIRVVYRELEEVKNLDDLKHDRVREALRYFGIDSNIEISSFSDIPVHGTGLGSSSSFTVGVAAVINRIKNGSDLKKKDLAELAAFLEIECCGDSIGKQDQYAAAAGGFNSITFTSTGVEIKPIEMEISKKYLLEDNLFALDTGISRKAADILKSHQSSISNGDTLINERLKQTTVLATESISLLKKGKIDEIGSLLDEAWQIKRKFTEDVTTAEIDALYEHGKNSGALGGKILGAGAGGYMLFYVPAKSHGRFLTAMEKTGKKRLPFKFTDEGCIVKRI